jgi:uncharacterized membrane protein
MSSLKEGGMSVKSSGFFGNAIILLGLLVGGYYLVDHWLISRFGVVRAWQIKHSLISAETAIYVAYAVAAIVVFYISAKFRSVRVLLAGMGVVAAVPFCIWLHGYLGSRYFNVIGKTFFYCAITGGALWLLFMILTVPLGVIRRFMHFSKESHAKIAIYEARAMAILADAKGRYRQSQYITVAGKNVFALDTRSGAHRFYVAPGKAELVEEEEIPSEFADMDATQVFEQIYQATDGQQNCPSLIIAGVKRSGKSTFAEYLTHQYKDEIDFIVIDPKQDDPKINWGPTTRVVGKGQNWKAISDEIDDALGEIRFLKVDRNRKKRMYLFDEWLNLLAVKENKFGEKVFRFMNKVLTELSYLGIGVIVLPHATTKTALGFPPGYGELKSNFDGIISFKYSLFTLKRSCFFEFNEVEYEIPLWNPRTARRGFSSGARRTAHPKNTHNGPFEAIPKKCAGAPDENLDPQDWRSEKHKKPIITDYYESRRDKFIVEAHCAGKSKRTICEDLKMSSGGTANAEINKILEKYGVSAGG